MIFYKHSVKDYARLLHGIALRRYNDFKVWGYVVGEVSYEESSYPYGLIGMTTGLYNTTYIDALASNTITNSYWVFPFYWENGTMIPGEVSIMRQGHAL